MARKVALARVCCHRCSWHSSHGCSEPARARQAPSAWCLPSTPQMLSPRARPAGPPALVDLQARCACRRLGGGHLGEAADWLPGTHCSSPGVRWLLLRRVGACLGQVRAPLRAPCAPLRPLHSPACAGPPSRDLELSWRVTDRRTAQFQSPPLHDAPARGHRPSRRAGAGAAQRTCTSSSPAPASSLRTHAARTSTRLARPAPRAGGRARAHCGRGSDVRAAAPLRAPVTVRQLWRLAGRGLPLRRGRSDAGA